MERLSGANHKHVTNPALPAVEAEQCQNIEVLTEVKAKSGEVELLSAYHTFKIYQKGSEEVRCAKIGDGSFGSVRRAWDRLIHDFPVSVSTQYKLLPLAFEGDARKVYEEVANNFIGASISTLWELLERRRCNEVH